MLRDPKLDLATKLEKLKEYRLHLESQYQDRCLLWACQQLDFKQAALSTYRSISGWPRNCHIDGQVLVISVDGCDQSKFAVPRFEGLKTVATLSL